MELPPTPLTALVRALVAESLAHAPGGRRLVAVDGLDDRETDALAGPLAAAFAERGVAAYRARMTGFLAPAADRAARLAAAGPSAALDPYDVPTFRRVLADPFRMGVGAGFQLAVYDPRTDGPREAAWRSAPADAVLIVDGSLLHRPDLAGLWRFSVWLRPTDAEPADLRAVPVLAEAGGLYLERDAPELAASAIVALADPERPRRVFADRC